MSAEVPPETGQVVWLTFLQGAHPWVLRAKAPADAAQGTEPEFVLQGMGPASTEAVYGVANSIRGWAKDG